MQLVSWDVWALTGGNEEYFGPVKRSIGMGERWFTECGAVAKRVAASPLCRV